jgi:phage-related protein
MCHICHNIELKKTVLLHKKAENELSKFPRIVGLKFKALFEILEKKGRLEQSFAKKLTGQDELFELRVTFQGQWRAVYAYVLRDTIVILSAFSKKRQKTPPKEIAKAEKRLLEAKEEL